MRSSSGMKSKENHEFVFFKTVKLPEFPHLLRRHTFRVVFLRVNSVIADLDFFPWEAQLYQLVLHGVRYRDNHVSHVGSAQFDVAYPAGTVSQSSPFLG